MSTNERRYDRRVFVKVDESRTPEEWQTFAVSKGMTDQRFLPAVLRGFDDASTTAVNTLAPPSSDVHVGDEGGGDMLHVEVAPTIVNQPMPTKTKGQISDLGADRDKEGDESESEQSSDSGSSSSSSSDLFDNVAVPTIDPNGELPMSANVLPTMMFRRHESGIIGRTATTAKESRQPAERLAPWYSSSTVPLPSPQSLSDTKKKKEDVTPTPRSVRSGGPRRRSAAHDDDGHGGYGGEGVNRLFFGLMEAEFRRMSADGQRRFKHKVVTALYSLA